MTLLDTLKSLLGLETSDRRREDRGEVGVTVEREPEAEPDAGTERAVKTDEAEPEPVSSPAADETAADETAADETAADDDGGAGAPADEGETAEPEIPDAEADASAEPAAEGTSDEPTDAIEGIGPAYADRLADAGVETVGQLATADAATLAEETDVSETRLERWIERANDF